MANYSLVINSRFRPFSYQEMLAPTLQSTQAHQALEDAYSQLGMQAGTVEAMLNRELDRDAYNQYQGYMQGLKESADVLATQGLNPSLRGSLGNLRTRYSQEIVPIQAAAQRRERLAEEQRKLGTGYAFEYDASTTGLDKFMNNPTFTPKQVNLADVRQRSAAEFGTLAKQLRNFKENPDMYRKGFDSTVLAEYGYSPEDAARIAESIRRGEVSPEDAAASAIYNSIYGSTGVDSWSNNLNEGQQAVRNAIAEGVVGAIGQMTPQIVTDKVSYENFKYDKELQSYKDKMKAKADFLAQQDAGNPTNSIYRYGTYNQYMTKEQRQIADDINELNGLLKYFDNNPEAFNQGSSGAEELDKWNAENKFGKSTLSIAGRTAAKNRIKEGREEQIKNYRRLVELSNKLSSAYSDDNLEFDFGVTQGEDQQGNPINQFSFNSNLGKVINGLAERRRPVLFRMNQKAMSHVTNAVLENIDVAGYGRKGENSLILDEDGKPLSESEFDKLHDLHWDDARIFYHHGKEMIVFPSDKGVKYELRPGALGDIGELYRNQMDAAYTNRQYDTYERNLIDYMNAVYEEYNTELQGQSETSNKLDFNLQDYDDLSDW